MEWMLKETEMLRECGNFFESLLSATNVCMDEEAPTEFQSGHMGYELEVSSAGNNG